MCKKNMCLVSVVLLLSVVGNVLAVDKNWNNNGGDRLWRNASNWSGGVPTSADKAGIRASILGPIVDSSTTAVANVVVLSDWSSSGDTLDITGGSLTTNGWFIIGYSASNDGTFNVDGGDTICNSHLDVGFAGTGHMEMTDGTVTVTGAFGIGTNGGTGDVQLDGGTISCGSITIPTSGSMDITGGTLIINGNQTAVVIGLVNAGKMTAYGGTGTILYDTTTNPGKTTVWADPDASTIPGNGDVNGDGDIDEIDLLLVAAEWLDPDPDPDADITRDGNVDNADFAVLAKNWHHNYYSRTLTGKIMSGYQGWFNHPGDGAGRGWVHWGGSNRFEPGYCSVDWWPDVSEYDADELYPTGFSYPGGSTAYVFSSHNQKTVLRHFSWMEEYGIDGAFLQRFIGETNPGSASRNHRDQVMLYCQEGANLHKRAWAMMYDLSSSYTATEIKDKIINDWKHLVDTYGITKDPADAAYLHHNGKPVVAVWGLLFDRSYEGQGTRDAIDFLANDPVYGGCSIMIGVGNDWLQLMNGDQLLQDIVDNSEIISPWSVGRYGSESTGSFDNFINDRTIPEQNWCNANSKDYLPVIWPGFSWYNNKHVEDPGVQFDQHPRLGGTFLWRQLYKNINDAGCTMIYQAMFDEVDEGTAIFKCTSTPPISESPDYSNPFLPTGNADHPAKNLEDADLPSDHYMWVLGEGAKMLRGETPLTPTMPTRGTGLINGTFVHWKLDETTGAVAADDSANGYDGTLVNMDNSDWVPGNTGNGLDFDGVNDHVVVDGICAAIADGNVTVSAWVNAPALNPATQFMISINSSNGDGNKLLLGTPGNTATLSFADSEPVWHHTTATVIDNTWHHIAYVLEDSADTITVYVDGSEVLSFTSTVSVAASDILSFGQEYDAGMATGDFYNGLLDDVRVYDRALSGAEIATLAQ